MQSVNNSFSPIQELAITSEAPSMSLISVAGSGKTFTLLQKIKYAAENKTLPKKTALIAFNKSIKEEWETYNLPITCFTYHSLGLKILREFGSKAKIDFSKYKDSSSFTSKEDKVLSEIRKLYYMNKEKREFLIEKIKDQLIREDSNPDRAQHIYRIWKMGISDLLTSVNFDDMIYGPIELNLKNSKYKTRMRMGFDLIIIDEVQDSSLSQIELVNLIAPDNVWLAGDAYQCQPLGTQVNTLSKGICNIEDLTIDDKVEGIDGFNSILKIEKRKTSENIIEIETEEGEISRYTEDHICLIESDIINCGSYLEFMQILAKGLKNGDKVYSYYYEKFSPIKISKKFENEIIVYSLLLDGDKSYFADGILTHNCINQFNGSSPWTMKVLQEKYKTKDYRLNESRRCSKAIALEASKIVEDFRALSDAKAGLVEFNSNLSVPFNQDLTILCRWNSPLIQTGLKLLEKNIPFYYRKDIIKSVIAILKRTTRPQDTMMEANIKIFKRYEKRKNDTIDVGMSEFEQDMFETLIGITSNSQLFKTIEDLIKSFSSMGKDKNATVLSTIHSYKGLENENIITLDYPKLQGYAKSIKEDAPENPEINCQYVAITRSKNKFLTKNLEDLI